MQTTILFESSGLWFLFNYKKLYIIVPEGTKEVKKGCGDGCWYAFKAGSSSLGSFDFSFQHFHLH